MFLLIRRITFFLIFLFFSLFCNGQLVVIETAQESLGNVLNSESFEENPIVTPDGSRIYFTRSGHSDNVGGISDRGDVWFAARFESGDWGPVQNAGTPINSNDKNTVIGFLNGGGAMLLTSESSNVASPAKGFLISIKEGERWGKPRAVTIPYFKSQSDFQSATISPDGEVIIFSLMTYGTYGVEDLYFTRIQPDGTWSGLRNLGPTINSRYQEMTPFISADSETIYFASNGYKGEGSLDIFWSKRKDDTWKNWTSPTNLGPMINTSGSESGFKFLPENDWAVLVSTQNSDGYGDLKKVKISIPEDFVAKADSISDHPLLVAQPLDSIIATSDEIETVTEANFRGRLIDAKTHEVIVGQVLVISESDSISLVSGVDGYATDLKESDYRLIASAKDYLEYDTAFTASNDFVKDFELQPLEVGNTITMEHVLFERGTTNLISGSEQDLEAVYHMLRDNPSVEIEVTGHTDNQGNFKLNVKLSQDRVDEVIKYLIDKGVNKRRLSGKGWGPMKPVANNASEESRQLNRRVDFTILKK